MNVRMLVPVLILLWVPPGRGAEVIPYLFAGQQVPGELAAVDELLRMGNADEAFARYSALRENRAALDTTGDLTFRRSLALYLLDPADSLRQALEALPSRFPGTVWEADLYRFFGNRAFRDGTPERAAHWYRRCLKQLDPDMTAARREVCLKLGIALRRQGEHLEALTFLHACRDDSLLGDYLLFWTADSYLQADSLAQALMVLHRLKERYRTSVLTDTATVILAAVHRKQGHLREALSLYRDLAGKTADVAQQAEYWYHAGNLNSGLGDADAAETAFDSAMSKSPRSVWAWKSRVALINLKTAVGGKLAGRQLFYNALVLASHGQHREATRWYEKYITAYPRSRKCAEAMYLLGKAHYRTRNYSRAAAWFERVLRDHPADSSSADALLYLARSQKNLGKRTASRDSYLRLARKYTWHRMADEALWLVAHDQETSATLDKAVALYQELGRLFPDRRMGQEASWRAGYCLYKNGRYRDAIDAFAAAAMQPQMYIQDQALFWAARAYRKLDRPVVADSLLAVAAGHFPRTYYAVRARLARDPGLMPSGGFIFRNGLDADSVFNERLGEFWIGFDQMLADDEKDAVVLCESCMEKGMRLLELDLWQAAERELREAELVAGTNRSVLMELSRLYFEHRFYYRAYRIFYRLLQLTYAHDSDTFPTAQMYAVYPLFHYKVIAAACRRYPGVDPFLVLALTMQESRFNPRATSRANARGLMQLLTGTGRDAARSLRIGSFTPDMLYDPDVNLRLGTHFLARQLERFNGNRDLTLAAYNGGPTNVKKWMKQFPVDDPEAFVEAIPFRETRKYVKIVSTNYWMYYHLWKDIFIYDGND